MKTFLLRATIAFLPSLITLICKAQPGSLDSSFGVNGKMLTSIGGNYSPCYGIVIQPDGKFVTAGSDLSSYNEHGARFMNFALARNYNDGKVDSSFGVNGKVITPFQDFDNEAKGVALQSNGKIIVTGYGASPQGYGILTRRYTASGKVDSTFGTNGYVYLIPNGDNTGNGVIVLPDDKILIAGYSTAKTQDFILIRFLESGAIDSSFGRNGIVTTDFNGRSEKAHSIAIQSDNKIVLSGFSGFPRTFAAARYNYNGSLDKNYGNNGRATISVGGEDIGTSSAIQKDNKLVIGGTTRTDNIAYHVVVRLDTNGKPDSSFGTNGSVSIYSVNVESFASAVAVQDDGKIVLAESNNTRHSFDDFVVTRFSPTGKIDSTFGVGGTTYTDFGYEDIPYAILIETDGKIVVAGRGASPSVGEGFAIARYKGDALPSLSISKNLSLVEGNSGVMTTAQFKVVLSKSTPADVLVNFTTKNLTALAGSDYTATSGALKIKAGKVSGNVVVPIIADNSQEANERFALVLSNPVNAVLGTIDSAICIIKNDDPSFSLNTQSLEDICSSKKSVKIYPNPVKDVINIHGLTTPNNIKLSIVDVNGTVLAQKSISTSSYAWDIKTLPSGSYFIQIQSKDKIETLAFIKQ